MEKLIKKINNKLAGLNDKRLDDFYQSCIDCFNKESTKPYDRLRGDYKAVYTYLLIISEIGIENSEKVRSLINKCSLFFCNNRYTNQLYEEYYDWLELLYKKGKLDLLNIKVYDNEEYDVKNAADNLNFANEFLMDNIFYIKKEDVSDEEFDSIDKISWLFPQFIEKDDNPIKAIIDLFKLCPKKEVFKQFLEINSIIDIYEGIKKDALYDVAIKCFSKNSINKDINGYVDRIIKDKNYNINNNKLKINKYYMDLSKKIKNHNTKNNKIRKNYNIVIDFLNKNNSYIDSIDKYLELIEDENILNDFLNYVIRYNSNYNIKIEKENIDLKKRQVSSLEILFNKYNFDFKKLEEDDKRKIQNIENIEEKLKLLSESSFKFVNTTSKIFRYLIIDFSIKQMSFLYNLYKNKIIDEEFLDDNIMELSNKDSFLNFVSNIELLKNIGLDKISRYNKNIFLVDSDLIKKRYKMFVDYYKMPTENIYNFEFLENDCIFDMIDNFIELGYLEQIRLNPDYLISRNFLMIKRLEIAKLIDMTVINSDNSFVGSIVSGNNFYVNDDMLDEFLIDYKDLYLKSNALDNVSRIDILDNSLDALFDYQEDEFTYKIGNTKLSRNRILRNLAAFDNYNLKEDLFYCILYGAVNLTEEEILDISRVCGHKTKVK